MFAVRSLSLIALGLLFRLPGAALAQGRIIPGLCAAPQPMDERMAIVQCRPTGAVIVRTSTDVRVGLVDRVLRYEVEERFTNRGSGVGEAEYLFPLPGGAAFQDLKLSINGELTAGETINATDARRIYEDIVRRQRDPALVEWMGYGLLRARIFPIAPGEEKRVVVRFQAAAQREGDAIRIDWFGEKNVARTVASGTPSRAGAVTFSLSYPNNDSYGRAYSPTHSLDLTERGSTRRADVRGDASDVTVLIPVRRAAEPSIATLAYAPGGEDGFALISVSPPAGADRSTSVTPRDITLVMDVSGSMSGAKMTQSRAAARQVLESLSPRDRFRLIDFSTDVHVFREMFSEASPANLRAAREYIDQLDASGSTNIGAALREAVRPAVDPSRLSVVLFITDGEPTIGERDPGALVNLARPSRGDPGRSPRRIFTFGVGSDVNASLLEQLALEGSGTSQFVRPEESVERAVGLVASRLVDPLLTNVHVRAEGNVRLSSILPPTGTDLFAGQDLVVLARYSGSGSTRIVVEGTRNGAPVRWTEDVVLPDQDRSNLFVARLWATQSVGYLAAEKRRGGSSAEVDREIRLLGDRYGVPTEFNSYLVKEPVVAPAPMANRGRAGRGGAGSGGGGGRGGVASAVASAASAADPKAKQFEAARAAADQRSATSLGTLDALADTANGRVRTIGGRTFTLKDSVWTDGQYTAALRTLTIKPYSKAWFDVVARLPELKAPFALGDQVLIAGRKSAIAVSPNGAESITTAELNALATSW